MTLLLLCIRSHFFLKEDRIFCCIGGWPVFKTFRKGLDQFHTPGFAGPVWHPADPNLEDIIVRPCFDVVVEATCIGFDHAVIFLSPDRFVRLVRLRVNTSHCTSRVCTCMLECAHV